MERITVSLTGTNGLLLCNPQTVNPMSAASKAIKELTDKRKRSDAENREILALKYSAALYIDEKGPYLPAYNIFKSAQEAARLSKSGKIWDRGIIPVESKCYLDYKGPKDPQGLWEDPQFVDIRDGKVGSGSRIVVARPVFPQWKTQVSFDISADVANPADVLAHLQQAGRLIGVGTYRARFGRFEIELVDSTCDLSNACARLGVEGPAKQTKKAA
jgi:hypothetical protein